MGEFMNGLMDNMQNDLFGYDAVVCSKENGCTYYTIQGTDGEVIMRLYSVFPGIALVYEDVHAQTCKVRRSISENIFEIHHCREGRLESNIKEELFYIGPGDLSIAKAQSGDIELTYPLHHFHGITVIIDVEKAPQCLSCFLEDVKVQPKMLMDKFCEDAHIFVARSMPSIAHVFEELYSVPESIRAGYFKVKVLELMLFLSSIDPKTDEMEERKYSHNQKVLAKDISQYLMKHMDTKITAEQLSDLFHVSATQIKCSIKDVYGTSLYRMIRLQKMQSAAKMLRETDGTILEIAGLHGYDNPSKFANAFKTVMGMTPKEYRKTPVEIGNIFIS